MKKSYLVLTGLIAIFAVVALFSDKKNEKTYVPRNDAKINQGATGAIEHYNLLRADPATGKIDPVAVANVQKAIQRLPINNNRNGDYNWINHGPDNVGGRTRALHVYKDNPNNMLAGGITGGLYKSTNAGATWTRLEGYNDNASICSVTRLGNGTIYVGSGTSHESTQGSTSNSGIIGHGLFKSTDDGQTFTNVFQPDGDDFGGGVWSEVDEVIASPINDNLVWVAYGGGLATYNDVTGEFIEKINFQVDDFDMSDDGQGIIAVRGSEIRVSLDGGNSFNNVVGNGDLSSSGGRKVVAISPDDKNYMYVTTTGGGSLEGVYASKNGGAHFSRIANDSDGGTNPFFSPFGPNAQGWYDNALTVMPNNPGVIILGGIELYRWEMSPSSTDTDINGGWDAISTTNDFPGNNTYVHADIHTFEWDSNGIFYTGCDGGIFRSFTPSVTTGFYNLNRDYRTTQYYGIGFNAFGNLFGGLQDNGTLVIPGSGTGGNTPFEAISIGGGDGFDVELSQEELLVFSASQYNNINFAYYNFNGGGSGGAVGLKPETFGQGVAGVPFYSCFKYYENMNEWMAPNNLEYIATEDLEEGDTLNYSSATFSRPLTTILDDNYSDGDTLYLFDPVQTLFAYGISSRVYLTRNIVNNRLAPTTDWVEYNINGAPICFEYSPDGDILYIGTTAGRIYRISDLRTAYEVEELEALEIEQIYSGGAVVTDLDLDPNDSNRLIASKGTYTGTSHVVYCEDAPNATGTDDFVSIWNIDGYLANMPVYSVTFDGTEGVSENRVLAGTEYGIFQTDDLGATQWQECNTGEMFRVPVYDLRQQNNEWKVNHNVIYAGTHGAGIFSAGDFNITGVEEIADQINSNNLNLMVYPNPVADIAKFDLALNNARYVNIEIFDTYGKHIRSINKGKVNQGKSTLSFDVQDMATGTYVLVINIEGEKSQSGKFVVTK